MYKSSTADSIDWSAARYHLVTSDPVTSVTNGIPGILFALRLRPGLAPPSGFIRPPMPSEELVQPPHNVVFPASNQLFWMPPEMSHANMSGALLPSKMPALIVLESRSSEKVQEKFAQKPLGLCRTEASPAHSLRSRLKSWNGRPPAPFCTSSSVNCS